ncbi:MAG: hypothetical protein QM820_08225 [Minicystis sp.]
MRPGTLLAAAAILAGLAAVPTIRRTRHHDVAEPSAGSAAPPPAPAAPAATMSAAAPAPPAATASPATTASAAAPPARGPRRPKGGMDVTFLVTADTHVGFWDNIPIPGKPSGVPLEKVHEVAIQAMNGIAGTPYPRALGGEVGVPRGLLIAGDLTEMGQPHEWARFEAIFGLTGKEGWVHYPVFEGAGNHDVGYGTFVEDQIKKRHGARRYSWDWDDLHIVCLGVAPDADDLAWLREDSRGHGPGDRRRPLLPLSARRAL